MRKVRNWKPKRRKRLRTSKRKRTTNGKLTKKKKAQEEEKARLLKIERERLMQGPLINENIVNADDRQRAIMMTKFAREQEDLKAKFGNDTVLINN